ncbi:MAG: aminotransferase class V-fold PLP-dependent enzyme [Chloracidobacterium sp.]|nr:aminotransferase class V-fold PLP-dependent enzyme [Chloracidobacterium sp.]
MIYFDNNATTQIAPKVFEAMRPFLETEYWNPSSAYDRGKETAKAIEMAREKVAALLGSANADEIAFTSGGTESDNWAILGALEANPEKDHIITTRVEHDAVRKLCEKLEQLGKRVTWLDVNEDGSLDIDSLRTSLDERTAIVSIMLANNETGILFPVEEIAEIVRENSAALVHVDGVNAAGKIAIDLKATKIDLFSISAHKFHGPKGVGALYIRDGVDLPSMYFGGGQENGRRAGTEAVHQIVAIGAAAELVRDMSPMRSISEMRDRLENAILATIPDAYLNGTADATKRLPNTSYISFANTNGETILAKLDEAGICVSTGSACNSQDHTPSGVLQAMNVPYARAMGAIRFSLGRNNTASEVETVIEVLPGIIENLRKLGN